ncbi:MAG: hypothetical protein Q7J30_02680 [Candidatus Azambacteria bacterium]|nr:hypothetical protein [Candidatus Azambacteria bacterium]
MGTLQDELKKNGKKVENIINSPLNLRIPTIKKVEVTADQEAIDKAVASARQYIADIFAHMTGLVTRLRVIESVSVEERAIRAKELEELEEEILAHLGAEDKLLGEAARQAYVMATIATLPSDEQAILSAIGGGNSHLPGLLKIGAFSEVVDGKKNANIVKVFGKTYTVNGGRAGEVANKLRKLIGEAYGKKIEAIKAKATISIDELFNNKPGLVFVNIPDEFVPVPNSKDGKKFLGGGALLVKSDGKVVRVAEFVGHLYSLMTKIAAAKVFMPIWKIEDRFVEKPSGMDEEMFYLYKKFHNFLRRGTAKVREVRQAARNEKHISVNSSSNGEEREQTLIPVVEGVNVQPAPATLQ